MPAKALIPVIGAVISERLLKSKKTTAAAAVTAAAATALPAGVEAIALPTGSMAELIGQLVLYALAAGLLFWKERNAEKQEGNQ
jgi:hypothetical protein